ncbi:hypothetical protein CPLU01_07239 [Colletotrichum plurivorum]|uniref:Uncharacterized protein n=1 Tax=Colletotrichum plurivorum TaxID=2175906 RepID=A0A8H6NFI3_9PEZI|nr:hypothetical protein CPLU01_07239 [Colletotrichum plurivorum]
MSTGAVSSCYRLGGDGRAGGFETKTVGQRQRRRWWWPACRMPDLSRGAAARPSNAACLLQVFLAVPAAICKARHAHSKVSLWLSVAHALAPSPYVFRIVAAASCDGAQATLPYRFGTPAGTVGSTIFTTGHAIMSAFTGSSGDGDLSFNCGLMRIS